MGYDCYVRRADGSTDHSDEGYFRRNIWGVGALRDALEAEDMGYWPSAPNAVLFAWPKRSDYPALAGLDELPEDESTLTPQQQAEMREYRAAYDRVLTYAEERPGIALHKFTSNDGWVVTAIECEGALRQWEKGGRPRPEAFDDDWIPFLRRAADNDGFVVW